MPDTAGGAGDQTMKIQTGRLPQGAQRGALISKENVISSIFKVTFREGLLLTNSLLKVVQIKPEFRPSSAECQSSCFP